MNDHRRPQAFHIDPAPKPDKVRRAPRAIPASKIKFEEEPQGQEVVVVPPAPLPSSRVLRWGSLLVSTLFGLFVMWAGLSITSLIEELFQRSQYLGWIGLALAGLAGLAALAIILREIWGLMRLNRIEHVQADAARALNHDDAAAAKRVLAALEDIYRRRPDAAWGLKTLSEHENDVMDAKDRIRLADRDLVSGFDGEAHRIIARRSRRVTMLTAVTPAAALDILFVAAQNLRMLREIATLYGGRPSVLATFRLSRMVIGHLAVTGGLALSDSVIQHVVGKGLIGRLSARFGEGAVNGILTARIGLAARDVCRPIPQEAEAKETLASLTRELLNFSNEGDQNAASPS
ncbi:YcjF family protein [Taklimakanibacter deserti]|uniref:YcjF family protein n=1 Tax=Taklimakanibacter deserti TaxID=2267839 RepID=UPI000E65C533